MAVKAPTPKILGAHHVAYRCRNAEETRAFYEDLLGLPLATVVRDQAGETPFLHLFFQLQDGNFIAFFDVAEDADICAWRAKDGLRDYHYAMEVKDLSELMGFRERLEGAEVDVFGPVDHGFVHSIYFWDPNGVALEFTCRDEHYDEIIADEAKSAHGMIRQWSEERESKQY